MSLTLFDILANMGAALPGGGYLVVGAVPFYAVYLIFVRLALWGAVGS